MDNPLYGIALRVRNLELLRAFYRDVLELGSPVLDSNFWVEFKLGDEVRLVLEKTPEGEALPDPGGRSSWMFKTDDVDSVISKLKLCGCEPKREAIERAGLKAYEFADPEGNKFLVCANAGWGQPGGAN